ncbi:MAG: hypothetical protein NZ992_03425 [Candidatus Korarchaeum sp.]|nr:hypothetical protein [Candidatus Korarchaeum sp.]
MILVSPKQLLQLGFSPKRVEFVYNSPTSSLKEYVEPNTPEGKLRLVYIGVLNKYRVKYLVKLVEILKDLPVEVIVGGFGGFEGVLKRLSQRVPTHLKFIGKVEDSFIQGIMLDADLVISYFDPRDTFNHVVALPNKFLYSLSIGRPVLVAKGTYLAELCERYGIGISVDIYDEESVRHLVSTFKELSGNKGPLIEMGRRALSLFNDVFSWEKVEKRYISMFNEVLLP